MNMIDEKLGYDDNEIEITDEELKRSEEELKEAFRLFNNKSKQERINQVMAVYFDLDGKFGMNGNDKETSERLRNLFFNWLTDPQDAEEKEKALKMMFNRIFEADENNLPERGAKNAKMVFAGMPC